MRLIDTDALLKELESIKNRLQMMDDTQTADKIMTGLFRATVCIKDAPAVDAAPVRHGYWTIRFFGDKAKCSECGRIFADVYDLEDYDHYCRHCGAVMESIKTVGKDGGA